MRLLTALLLLSFSINAQAWWNEEWTQRKNIKIDTTAAGANTQLTINEVPVLVRLHTGNFPQFLMVRDNAADFRFISGDDVTPLKYHVERFDPISGMALVWVKAPVVNPQTDLGEMYLYFGNQQAPKADDPGATFDVNTVTALHFNETSSLPRDFTAYATPVESGDLLPNPASLIGQGATLTGNAPIVFSDVPQLQVNPESGWTFETWVQISELPAETVYLLDHGDAEVRTSITITDSALVASHNGVEVASFTPFNAAQWHHVAFVIGPTDMQLYLDGKQVGGAAVTPGVPAGKVRIGGAIDDTGLLTADLDELRFSNVARGADWINFSALVQGTGNDQVMRYQIDESIDGGGGASTGHFGIILQNVFGKPEAWVEQAVILLCAFMMIIAIVIMFLKAVDLRRATKASKQFLQAFTQIGTAEASDLQTFYNAGSQFGDSPLWRVYRTGIDEIRKRVSPSVGADSAPIDTKAMSVVRAAMDAAMVREGQRLNSKLVLLTIAISGGPFIGLFGTVVGVMVTFAAIAATGDVNISAIAPGMAAALLATVAGLGVAIPSLFGYNWLGSQAKELVADMQVFADELEARFNEEYG